MIIKKDGFLLPMILPKYLRIVQQQHYDSQATDMPLSKVSRTTT